MRRKKVIILVIATGICWISLNHVIKPSLSFLKNVNKINLELQNVNLRKEIELLRIEKKKNKKKNQDIKESAKYVTTGLDRSITELFKEKEEPTNTKVPSLFHLANNAVAYPSLSDDRMVQQLYYNQEKEKQNKNLSITVVVDGGWAWDEKEFAGNKLGLKLNFLFIHF